MIINALRLFLVALFVALLLAPQRFVPLLQPLNRPDAPIIYPYDTLLNLALNHLFLVAVAIFFGAILAIAAAIFVTRPLGKDFLALSRTIANVGQTFPPVAVLALAVPAVGFGVWPTLIALFLYSLLPVFENTLAGLQQVPDAILESADGMGMSGAERLFKIELPLALPYTVEGVKVASVISIGTATIGSTVAAKGLGEVIIAGLLSDNVAFIMQGAVVVGLMAVLIYESFGGIEAALMRRFGLPQQQD